jgi:sortase A
MRHHDSVSSLGYRPSEKGRTMTTSRSARPGEQGRVFAGTEFLVGALRARPVARRLASGLSILLAVLAVGLLAYPIATNFYQGRLQSKLAIQLAKPEIKRAYAAGRVAEGDSLTRLRIPATGVDVVVVEGTSASALRAGAGHYPATPLPGEEGNVAIAGHRTTYGKPFADNDKLRPGDTIVLDTPLRSYTYRVSRDPFVVAPTDFQPIAQTPGFTLTLTTCHPKGSAKQRLIVRAELVPTGTTPS